jgi:maltose/moltooligosaccharide transporter
MDASINISMEPFRAFVGDNLPAEQRTLGFATQSFFIGVGAIVASALPYILTNWFGVANTAAEGEIADSVRWSFYIGGAVFLLAVLWTVFRSHEYSPEELETFGQVHEEVVPDWSAEEQAQEGKQQTHIGLGVIIASLVLIFALAQAGVPKEVYLLVIMLGLTGILWVVAGLLIQKGTYQNGFVAIMSDLLKMPQTMKQLAVVQFFTWFALFSMWIYTTAAVTKHIYGTSDPTSALYNEGADWVGVCFAVYNGIAAIVAFGLPWLAKLTNRRITHLLCLVLGGLGLLSIYFVEDPRLIMVSMVGVGIAWASILSMPYAMLAGALPANKMGYYMGVFNFFIVIPQLVAATILGFLVNQFFGGEAIYALVVGGGSLILAGLLTLRVNDVDEE